MSNVVPLFARPVDEHLVHLGYTFNRLKVECEAAWSDRSLPVEEQERLSRPVWSVVDRIVTTKAHTAEGHQVKARVALWMLLAEGDHDERAATREERLVIQVLRHVLERPLPPPGGA